jgi:hypothetical protein
MSEGLTLERRSPRREYIVSLTFSPPTHHWKKETGDPRREHFDYSHAGIEAILPKTPLLDPVVVSGVDTY